MEFKLINLFYLFFWLINLLTICLSSKITDLMECKNEKIKTLIKFHPLILIFISIVNSVVTCFTSADIALSLVCLYMIISFCHMLIVGCINTYIERHTKW